VHGEKGGAVSDELGEGKCREAFFWGRFTRNRREGTLQAPKRGSPGDALIEFVLRFRLSKRIAHKALFIQKDGCGVLFLPCEWRITAT